MNYDYVQLVAYGVVTSEPTQVLPDGTVDDYKADLRVRAETLCKVGEWVQDEFDSELRSRNRTLKVLIVPEFYFRFGGPSERTVLRDSYADAEQLLPNIVEEVLRPTFGQGRFGDWLIVAGTAFWHKSAEESGVDHPTYFNTSLVLNGGSDTQLDAEERSRNNAEFAVPTMSHASTNQKQLMSQIDYAFGGLGRDRRRWDAALNPMFELVLGDWEWWRWHTFHAHGVKRPDGHPLTFGLEVCLEHAASIDSSRGGVRDIGVLRSLEQYYQEQVPGDDVPRIDVQLLTSCGMSRRDATGVAAREDGLVLRCDGMQPSQGVHATWPNAEIVRVIDITDDGGRVTSPVMASVTRREVPAQLQVGYPGNLHTPRDTVAVWEPVPLPD